MCKYCYSNKGAIYSKVYGLLAVVLLKCPVHLAIQNVVVCIAKLKKKQLQNYAALKEIELMRM